MAEQQSDVYWYSRVEQTAYEALLHAVTAWQESLPEGARDPQWHAYEESLRAAQGALTIELRVNGVELPFTPILNAMQAYVEKTLDARAADLLRARGGVFVAQIDALTRGLVREFDAKARALFPEFRPEE